MQLTDLSLPHNDQGQDNTGGSQPWCEDIELAAYLADALGPPSMTQVVMDLRLTHKRFGSSSNLPLMGNCTTLFLLIHHLVDDTRISQFVACSVHLDSDNTSTVDGDCHM